MADARTSWSNFTLFGQDEYPMMINEVRTSFEAWATKEARNFQDAFEALKRDRRVFEAEKERREAEFTTWKTGEYDEIRDRRRRAEQEATNASRQIKADRDDMRNQMEEERMLREQELARREKEYLFVKEKHDAKKAADELEMLRVQEHDANTENLVEINVGGEIFQAARTRFTGGPVQSGGYLDKIMNGQVHAEHDRDGRIFVNSDPVAFRAILNYLRNPQLPPISKDAGDSEVLAREADFYGIHFYRYPLVYVLGGHNKEHLATIDMLDLENRGWRQCRSMSTPRAYFGAASHLSRLYAYGGQNLQYRALRQMDMFDCIRGDWIEGPDLQAPRRNCASCKLDDGRILAIGGYDGQQIVDTVEAYDPREKSWSSLPPLNVERSAAAATNWGGKIWVLGGTSGYRRNDGEVFDPRAERWEPIPPMAEVRSACQAATCIGRVYAFGGVDDRQNPLDTIEAFRLATGAEPETGKWQPRKSMQKERVDFGATVAADHIWVTGGQRGEILDDVEIYNPESNEWQYGPPMISKRYGHQMVTANL